jgi:hypothetical protein
MIIEAGPYLDEDQKAILYIDIYPVHTSQEFPEFVFEIRNIILIFVPGNCTGIFQPQDVGLQCIAKHKLKQSMPEDLVRCYQEQIAAGITPEKFVFSSSYPVLRDASVRACVDLYDWLLSGASEAIIKWVCLSISLFYANPLKSGRSHGKNASYRANLNLFCHMRVSPAAQLGRLSVSI